MHAQDLQSRKTQFSELLGGIGGLAGVGDPGDEHVVRVVDEVVSRQGVDGLAIAAVVRGRDGDELAVARGCRDSPGPSHEVIAVVGEKGGSHEDQRIVAGPCCVHDRGDRRGVAYGELMDEALGVGGGHVAMVGDGADTSLTPRWRKRTRRPGKWAF